MSWSNPVTKPAIHSAWETADRSAGNRLLAALPDDLVMLLQADLGQVTLAQGAVCYGAGDAIDRVYFPHTGLISLAIVADGEMVEISSVGREGAVGLQSGFGRRLSFTRATVQISGTFSAISAPHFEHATSRSVALRSMISRYIETMWAEAQQNAACNAIHDGSSRLCRVLLQCVDRTGINQLPLTQDCLAAMLGVRRTTVTLLAQQLQNRGIVRYSRGRITILDRLALKSCACTCYHAINHKDLLSEIGN
jgi:CRP-like cAMP-binding protein